MYSIGIDVGGTFTDFFCFDHSNQQTFVYKIASTPDDPSQAVCTGLEALLTKYSIKPTEVSTIFHGTTVGTNSILEGKGAKVGLITNSGFRDILHIGRHQRPQHYSIGQEIPWQNRALIERKFRKTIDCRLDSSGNEIIPLDETSILKSVTKTGCIVTAEEHNYYGGLGESVARVLSLNSPTPQEFVATNDTFGESGTPAQLMKKYGLDSTTIIQKAEKVIARK